MINTKNYNRQSGYTIIEMLAVVSILVVITGIITSILYSTLRQSSKVKITTDVAQNGQYATSVLRSIITDSRDITQIDGSAISDCTANPSGVSSITLKRLDGGSTVIACTGNTIASNSASLINNQVPANNQPLKVQSCTFACSQLVNDPYSVPRVDISFSVSDLNTGQFETKSSATFSVSTSLRVYSP